MIVVTHPQALSILLNKQTVMFKKMKSLLQVIFLILALFPLCKLQGAFRNNFNQQLVTWMNSLFYLPPDGQLRIRKEYRMMTNQERNDYHRAVLLLKQDRSVSPNRYDALANFHSGLTSMSAHGGPNFLGWHRVYILMFENALREMIPDVTLPYWDSTFDDETMNPTMSIVWTNGFLGNGDGLVTTGPFAFWRTASGPLTRNIGISGQLMRTFNVRSIINRVRLVDISEPTAFPDSNLEFHHGGVHIWVDGQMGSLNTAAQDPVFWLHHAFVDYVWELFRRNQRVNGIDPTTDYPTIVNNSMHAANAPLGLANMRNIDSLGDQFSQIYSYERHPTCSVDFPDCGSSYFRCDMRGFPRCVPLDQITINQQNTQFNQNGARQVNNRPNGGNQNNFGNGPFNGGTTQNNQGIGNGPFNGGTTQNNQGIGQSGNQMNMNQMPNSQTNTPMPNMNGMMQTNFGQGNQQNINNRPIPPPTPTTISPQSFNNGLAPPPLPSANSAFNSQINTMVSESPGVMPGSNWQNIGNMQQPNPTQRAWQQNNQNPMARQFPSQMDNMMTGGGFSGFNMQENTQRTRGQNMGNRQSFGIGDFGSQQSNMNFLPPGVRPSIVTNRIGRKRGKYYAKRSANRPQGQSTAPNHFPGLQANAQCPAIPMNRAYQNTFTINGISDIKQWAFIPVKIYLRRPPGFNAYHGYPVVNGEVSAQSDIFSPGAFKNLQKHINLGHPASFSRCDAGQSGVGKIFVKSNGMNYMGTYKEFAIVDNRLALSISTTYIGVKNPSQGMSLSQLSASDSCGRMCRPYCRIKGSQKSRPCSGVVRMTSTAPQMYGVNYGEAVLDVWNFSPKTNCPNFNEDQIFLTFYCDYGDRWFWKSQNTPPRQQRPGVTNPLSPFVPTRGSSGITTIGPNTPMPLSAGTCDIGHGCYLPGNCTTVCQPKQILECAGTCGMYARCHMGMYHVEKCAMRGRFDAEMGQCVPAECLDEDPTLFFNPYA
ncbi:hypothetical protein ScPMuIL_001948 [Solemya velum]